jgi:hypothetical protein
MFKICRRISDTDTQNSHSIVRSCYSLPDVPAGRIARELWWTSHEFSSAVIIIIITIVIVVIIITTTTTTMALHSQISPGG